MNIPLLYAPSIPMLLPLEEKGFLEVGFKPLYNPNILVCDSDESKTGDLPIACKGVLIAFDATKRDVYVGHAGIKPINQDGQKKQKSNLSGNEYSRLYRVLYEDDTIRTKIPDWDRAILMFDWENDIKVEEDKKKSFRTLKTRIDDEINRIIKDEVFSLKKILLYEINNSNNWHLKNNRNEVPNSLKGMVNNPRRKNMLSPNSERCKYYITIVMKLMEEIANGNIKIP